MSKKSEQRLQKRLKKQEKARNDTFSHQPILQQVTDSNDFLLFSFRNLVSEFGLKSKQCNDRIRSQLLIKLHTLSCCTWNQLIMKNKQSGGIETVKRESLKVSLPRCVTEDIEKLYVFRFNGQNSRVIGMRSGNVFHVLFVDVELDCYDH